MSNNPIQPIMHPDDANNENQSTPNSEMIEAGEETAAVINESPLIEDIAGESPETTDDSQAEMHGDANEGLAIDETAVNVEPAAVEKHAQKKRSFFEKMFGHRGEEKTQALVDQKQPVLESLKESAEPVTEQGSLVRQPAKELQAVEEIQPATPAIDLDDVRSVVREEIEQVQNGITSAIQLELSRIENDEAKRSYDEAQNVMGAFYHTKGEVVFARVQALKLRQAAVFNDTTRSIKEIRDDINLISEMLGEAQKDLTEVEQITASRAEAMETYVANMGLQQQVAALQQAIETRPANPPKSKPGGLGLWSMIALAILIVAVGVLGYFFPIPTEAASEANARALIETASLYQVSGQPDDVERVLDEAIKAGVSNPDLLGRSGQLYMSINEYKKAESVLKEAVLADPERQTFRLNLARTYAKLGSRQDAITQYNELIKLTGPNVIFYVELGNQYELLQKYTDAEAQYNKAIEADPNRYEGYFNLGQLYRVRLLDYVKAEEQYKLALDKRPDVYLAKVYYGASLAGQKKYNDAIAVYLDAITDYADGQSAPFYMAEAYRAMGKYEEAIPWYQRALELSPNSIQTLIGLGKTYDAQNNCTDAAKTFAEVLRIQPKNEDAQAGFNKCAGK